jgi:hypothetical protein
LSSEASGQGYWAFISYSRIDVAWATWLHHALETYRIPRPLVGRPSSLGPIPPRLFPVFRDDAELAGAPSLGASIDTALRASRTLIVLCSPHAAASPWVDREIRRFRELGGADRILALLVEGEPRTSFPAALGASGGEPLAADVRGGRSTQRAALLKLVAGILGLSYDDLVQREAGRRRRNAIVLRCAAAGAVVLAALSYAGLADNRNDVPYAPAIRAALDRSDLSVFRRVVTDVELRRRAASLRGTLVGMLAESGRRTALTWMFDPHAAGTRDPWTAAQTSAGAFAATGVSAAQILAFGRNLDLAFEPGQPQVDAHGALYGWKAVGSTTSAAEVTLWTAFALELELANARLDPVRRRTVAHELALAQSSARLFGPFPDGHFGAGPRQIGGYSTYATVMAYLALLGARETHVGWDGSAARREATMEKVRGFLLRHFGEASNGRGWLPDDNPDAVGHTYEGLDDQIVSAFLRDERTGGKSVPPAIARALPAMMRALELRRFDVQFSSAILSYRCLDASGARVTESRLIEFDWYQWAIAAAAEWLQVLQRQPHARHDDVVEARRILQRLIVDDGDDMLRTIVPKHNVWVSAETAYALGSVVTL